MTNSEIACFLTYLIVFFIIFLPLIGSIQMIGIIIGLLGIIGKILSFKYWRNAVGLTIEIMLLGVGIFCTAFGGNLMIRFGSEKMENIKLSAWVFIILTSFCTYYNKIFFLKIMKNTKNIDKIILVNSITFLVTIPIDFFMFKQKFSFRYLIFFLLLANSIFFGINVCKRSQHDKNLINI
jgi:type III secretory pathway component EscS